MTELEIAAAIATIAAFILAGWQYTENRRRTRTERERLARQGERLRSMVVAAKAAVDTADYLVQRSKDEAAPAAELISVARVMRGQLSLVVSQLDQEEQLVAGSRAGHAIDSERPVPAADRPALAAE